MYGRFHDSDYDGIVLKVPLWFIELNNLGKSFEDFKQALLSAERSSLYGDHLNNLYEINNYQSKKEIISKQRIEKNNKLEADRVFEESIFKGEIFRLEWQRCSERFSVDSFYFLGNHYGHNDIYTNKCAIKSTFAQQIKSYSSDCLTVLKQIYTDNPVSGLERYIADCSSNLIQSSFNLSPANIYTFSIVFSRLHILTNYHKKGRGHNTYCNRNVLKQNEKGFYYTEGNRDIFLQDYKIRNNNEGIFLIK